MPKKAAYYTLGCKLNFAETSTYARQLRDAGYAKAEFTDRPDIFLINTCSVTEEADRKCRKVVRQALRINPEAIIVVVGCYAQLKPVEISSIPGVDLVLGAEEKFNLIQHLPQQKGLQGVPHSAPLSQAIAFHGAYSIADRTRAYLKIQDGCDYKCSFCTIPQARGLSRSDAPENILQNAKAIAATGTKEITLAGVNIGDYHFDTYNFYDLLRMLDNVEGIDRIRISSIEPNLLTDDIIRYVAQSRTIMPHFHIPLQSGNNEMLSLMRRRYRRELYADRVQMVKSILPHAAIGVDVISGFPGETDQYADDTYHFLEQLPVTYLHAFTYSERDNTPAAGFAGKVPESIRTERTNRLRLLSEAHKRRFYQEHLNTIRPVLWEEERESEMMVGFTDNYIKVSAPFDPVLPGEIQAFRLQMISGNNNVTGYPVVTLPAASYL